MNDHKGMKGKHGMRDDEAMSRRHENPGLKSWGNDAALTGPGICVDDPDATTLLEYIHSDARAL